jgi:cysteinyl-tRNA synthetase
MAVFRDAQKKQAEYAKNLLEQVATGQAGREAGAQFQQAATDAAQQNIQAVQAMQNVQAMGQASGSPVAKDAALKASQEATETAAEQAVKVTGQAKDFQQKAFEAQQAQALAAMAPAVQAEIKKREQDMALAGGMIETVGQLIPGMTGVA